MELFDYLNSDTIVLTPNRRLSATFSKLHHQHQIQLGKHCWTTLDILPFPSWVQRLWQQYVDSEMEHAALVLTPSQEQLIWEDIIRQSAVGEDLLQLSNTAELAKSAWGILRQWRVELTNPALQTTEDGVIFVEWAQRFQTLCAENNWLDTNSVTALVTEKISSSAIQNPVHLILSGFTEISPLNQKLLDTCKAAGTDITVYQAQEKNNSVQRISLKDEEAEIRTMGQWAKALWEKNPAARIGCIFQRLEDLRPKVIKIFSEIFAEPGTYCLNYTRYPFNISAGRNLSLYPVIQTALSLLSFPRSTVQLLKLTPVLLSPFVGQAESEMVARAKFDMELRRTNMLTVKLNDLSGCPAFAALCEEHKVLNIDKKTTALPSAWVEIFMRQLKAFQWPGERSLNSQEYQVVDSWLKLLKEFSTFDTVLGEMKYSQALRYLNLLTTKKIFQPESPEAPIQILGMLEATEHPFDFMWVMGLDDAAWPPAPKPNPFIPQRLQRTMQMPHATAERELIYCQTLTNQLKRGAPVVMFSYSEQNEDAELRPSPIITPLPEIHFDKLSLAPFISPAHLIYDSKKIEVFSDEIAPFVQADEVIRGGAAIFKLQAACPFKAFAELRLHAKRVDAPTSGLPAHERGTLVHKTMEIIWQRLGDLTALQNMSQEDLQELIQTAATTAITALKSPALQPRRFRELESLRLQKIIALWMEHEKGRYYFKVIANELEQKIEIANLSVNLRIDRIDQLENGKKVIIDYKTGKAVPVKQWFSERPDEPQLPLYCVLDPKDTTGILFACLNPEDMGYSGVSETNLNIKSIKPLEKIKDAAASGWIGQTEQWQRILTRLGTNFSEGIAAVDPKSVTKTCEHCHLHALCRIDEVVV
jgi:ATP-dependent helicase/nuclease subunit B